MRSPQPEEARDQREAPPLNKMGEAFNAEKYRQVVQMEEEGLAVAGEVRRARPDVAARIYRMLGTSFLKRFEHVKGLGLLEGRLSGARR